MVTATQLTERESLVGPADWLRTQRLRRPNGAAGSCRRPYGARQQGERERPAHTTMNISYYSKGRTLARAPLAEVGLLP